jgi:hypothetical protein
LARKIKEIKEKKFKKTLLKENEIKEPGTEILLSKNCFIKSCGILKIIGTGTK